jgi:hypothetical protein
VGLVSESIFFFFRVFRVFRGLITMIIVLKPHSTEEQIDHILERIQELGLKPHLSRGEQRTIIGGHRR